MTFDELILRAEIKIKEEKYEDSMQILMNLKKFSELDKMKEKKISDMVNVLLCEHAQNSKLIDIYLSNKLNEINLLIKELLIRE